MKYLKKSSLLIISLSIISNYSAFAMETAENKLTFTEEIKNENISVTDAYYKKYPYDFLENKLIKKPNPSLLIDACIFLGSSVIVGSLFNAILQPLIKSSNSYFIMQIPSEIIAQKIGGQVIGAISGSLVGMVSTYLIHKSIYNSKQLNALILILNNYQPDLNKNNTFNTKQYIPECLHSTFDALWLVYQKNGKDVLEKEWNKIKNSIEENLKYEIKAGKYLTKTTLWQSSPIINLLHS